jgi:hypothetical protein
LRPASQRWVIVARAELVQAGAAVQVASSELPGIVQPALLLLTDDVTVGFIVVTVNFPPLTASNASFAQPAPPREVFLSGAFPYTT